MDHPLFHDTQKITPHPSNSNENWLTTLTPEQLLNTPKRQELIQRIKKLNSNATIDESEQRFSQLITPLINTLCLYFQKLPASDNQHYAQLGGLIDHSLNRTEAALQLAQEFILKDSHEGHTKEQLLWIYALTTASLLLNIGKLYTEFSVQYTLPAQHAIIRWNPLQESLAKTERHYQYQFKSEPSTTLRHRITLILAKQLMPTSGFKWISSNENVLAVWLALLNEDREGAGTLGAILDYADAIAIQRYLMEYIQKMHNDASKPHRMGTFIDKPQKVTIHEQEQLAGAQFLQWLKQSLEKGKITLNQKIVWLTSGGLVMSPEAFDLFLKDFPGYRPQQAIQRGFLSWGYGRINSISKIIIKQTGLILPQDQALKKNTHAYLTTQGHWVKPQKTATLSDRPPSEEAEQVARHTTPSISPKGKSHG